MFATRTLAFRSNLPRPSPKLAAAHRCAHVRESLNIGGAGGGGMIAAASHSSESDLFPDAVACQFDTAAGEQLAVAYSDHTLVLWDVSHLDKVGDQARRAPTGA
jgi:hypothetical protein